MTFPDWARIALGIVVGVLTFLISGGIELHITEELRGLLAAIAGTLASFGFVPPKPGSVLLPQPVRLLLALIVPLAVFFVNILIGGDLETLRAVIAGVITLVGSYFVVPPQVNEA